MANDCHSNNFWCSTKQTEAAKWSKSNYLVPRWGWQTALITGTIWGLFWCWWLRFWNQLADSKETVLIRDYFRKIIIKALLFRCTGVKPRKREWARFGNKTARIQLEGSAKVLWQSQGSSGSSVFLPKTTWNVTVEPSKLRKREIKGTGLQQNLVYTLGTQIRTIILCMWEACILCSTSRSFLPLIKVKSLHLGIYF